MIVVELSSRVAAAAAAPWVLPFSRSAADTPLARGL